jgi:hypothetical protein
MPRHFCPYVTIADTLIHSIKAVVPRQGNIKFPKYDLLIYSFMYCVSNTRNSIRQLPFSESVSRSAGQEIPFFLKNAKDNRRIHIHPLPDLGMSQPQFKLGILFL